MVLEVGITYEFSSLDRTVYSGIYKITEKSTGKVYVGQSKDLLTRMRTLKYSPSTDNPGGFQEVIKKIGAANFVFEIIEFTSDLYEREMFYIKHFNACNPDMGFNKYPCDKSLFNRLLHENKFIISSVEQ